MEKEANRINLTMIRRGKKLRFLKKSIKILQQLTNKPIDHFLLRLRELINKEISRILYNSKKMMIT